MRSVLFSLALLAGVIVAPNAVHAQDNKVRFADPANGSAVSIPLKIEKVMSPNLSPFSNSAVTVAGDPSGTGKKISGLTFSWSADLNGTVVEVDELLEGEGTEMTFV